MGSRSLFRLIAICPPFPSPGTAGREYPRTDVTKKALFPCSQAHPFIIMLQIFQRAAHPTCAPVEYVGVNHGGGDIGVTQQLLHRANIITILQ